MEIKRDVWSLLLVLLLGQLVAFAMAASSFTSSVIANLGSQFLIGLTSDQYTQIC
jgi:solute carrier family 35 protein F1/2